MSKELVIAANRHETKVAILEDDQLVEVIFQRANEYSLAGSIHKGRVTRVLPGMQSAFVDLGLDRDTFLYVSDFFEENEDFDRVMPAREDTRRDRESRAPAELRAEQRPLQDEIAPPPGAVPEPELHEEREEPVRQQSAAPLGPPQPGATSAPRTDDGDRDRHGRRSRRRRNRGRGFPDSKYAPAESRFGAPEGSRPPRPLDSPVVATPVPSRIEEPAAPRIAGEFPVLPGESLAKYSRSNIQPLDEAEEEEIRNLQESVEAVEPETSSEIVDEVTIAVIAQPEETITVVEPPPLPETHFTPPVEPVVEHASAALIVATPEPPPLPEEGVPQAETAEAGILLEESLEEAEAEPLEDTTFESSLNESTTESAAEPLALAEEAGSDAPQTAQVREPGGRYPHRAPRRARRRMRGASHNEGRFEPRAEGAPNVAPAETPIVRPESPRVGGRPEKAPLPSITELLKEGQEIIVQIAKEPLGQKGARITSHIALPGRYVVYMPTLEHTGVSRKIASDEERLRLKKILQIHHVGISGGFIVRTAGEGKTEEELAADMNFLYNLWLDIRQKAEKKPAPLLLHHDLDIVQRTLRDQFTEEFKAIWVDNEELYENVLRFVQRFHPSLVPRVKLYTRPEPIFDAFNITAELEKALRPKVWLKSGGYIVINQTEALVAIDINTGKYVGRSNRLEDTIVKTNTEAVKEIVRQIRLRDLGGIIVVDFIDMDERKNRQKVMQALEEAMRVDKAPYKILQFNDFGLVAITRKRVKQSLEKALCMPCPHCEGAGYVKSIQTVVAEILQEAHKIARAVEGSDVMLRAHPDVAKLFKSNQNKYLEELEETLRRPVLVKGDPLLHHEKFDLA